MREGAEERGRGGDTITLPPLARPAGPGAGTWEARQCLLLTVAAGWLSQKHGRLPTEEEVWHTAAAWRQEMCALAWDAEEALGPCPQTLTQTEDDCRVFIHDLVYRDHDRDYRSLAAFVAQDLEEWAVVVLRVDFYGRLAGEVVAGCEHRGAPCRYP